MQRPSRRTPRTARSGPTGRAAASASPPRSPRPRARRARGRGRPRVPPARAQALGRLLSRVLRGALRAERVLLGDEDAVAQLAFDADLAPDPEHVRHRARVDDGNARGPGHVADAE